MSSPFEDFLDHFDLEEGKRLPDGSWMVRCPGPNHSNGDLDPSLHVSQGGDGRVLLKCMSGDCTPEEIVCAKGMTMADLFPTGRRIVASYDYTDEDGKLLSQVVRRDPKDFRQRRPDPDHPGRWIYNMKGVRSVLYRLPEVLAAVREGELVWIVEGEKDADALANLGLTATTCSMGAGKWRREHSELLRGARVVVIPDNDNPGRKHAQVVAKSLAPLASEVKILQLPVPEKGDVSDWLACGGSADELAALADHAPIFAPQNHSETQVGTLLSDVEPEEVRWLWPGRIPLGKLTILDGDPGLGKSNLTLDIAARVTTGRPMPDGPSGLDRLSGVVILTLEDGLADTVRPRVDASGGDPSRIICVGSVPDQEEGQRPTAIPADLHYVKIALERVGALLVIVDPLTSFIPADTDTYKDHSVRLLLTKLSVFAEETGAAVVLIRHLNKASGLSALYRGGGSIAFIAAARSGLIVAKDPANPELRILASQKNNLARDPVSLAFHLEEAENGYPHVVWDGESSLAANDLLRNEIKRDGGGEREFSRDIVSQALSHGPMSFKDLCALTHSEGISRSMTRKALADLGCTKSIDGFQGPWRWELPDFLDFDGQDDH